MTGGSRGIRAAICQAFAQLGDAVAVHCGANRDAAKALVASLPGSGHVVAQADLRDADAVQVMVDGAAAALGGIDVLVNNAGVFVAHQIDEVTYQEWQQAWADTLGVNLVGAANVTWCAVRHMPRDGSARIVNVGSRGRSVASRGARLTGPARQHLPPLDSRSPGRSGRLVCP